MKFDVIAIDFLNYAHRYNWVLKDMKTEGGEPTGVIFGVLRAIIGLWRKYSPRDIYVLHEGGSNWRKSVSFEYKEKRAFLPDDIRRQSVILRQFFFPAIGIGQVFAPHYEADDIASHILSSFSGKKILLCSNDHDWCQLTGPKVYLLRKHEPKNVFDLLPQRLPMLWSILGDPGDGVIGIKYRAGMRLQRLPSKVVVPLVRKYKTLEDLYDHLEEEKGLDLKWKKLLIEDRELVFKNEKLVRLPKRVPGVRWSRRYFQRTQLYNACREFEIRSIAENLEGLRYALVRSHLTPQR